MEFRVLRKDGTIYRIKMIETNGKTIYDLIDILNNNPETEKILTAKDGNKYIINIGK